MAQPVIYLDKSLLLNFTMDFLLLYLTARISGYRTSIIRLTIGAVLGSLYILAIFLPQINFLYNMSIKFLYSCLVVAVVFFPFTVKKFLVCLGYFYAVSFAIGGAIYGFSALSVNLQGNGQYEILVNLLHRTAGLTNLLAWGFPLALLFWVVFGRFGWSALKRSLVKAVFRFPVCVSFKDVELCTEGLVDTGNHLRDPLTKIPVVVIEVELLLPHLPKGFGDIVSSLDFAGLEDCLRGTHWEERLRLIPFTSVGKQNGIMIGFIPDSLVIKTTKAEFKTTRAIVGLYAKNLSPDGAYRALLHPDLLPAAG